MRSLCGLVAVLVCPAIYGQFSGRITGQVVDSSGAAVPGADVQLSLSGGTKPLLTTKTSHEGIYHFIGVRPSEYDLSVEASGFVKKTLRNVSVDPALETTVPTIKLELATLTQTVDVSANVQSVETSNAEVSGTITMEEVQKLPILDRDPLALIQTQPGVVSNGNSTTVINGLRTSYSNMTLDGINIQDNYIRDNALDYHAQQAALGTGAADDAGYVQPERGGVRRRHPDGLRYAVRHQPVPRRSALVQPQQLLLRQRLVQQPGRRARGRSSTRTSSAARSADRSARTSCSSICNYEAVRRIQQTPARQHDPHRRRRARDLHLCEHRRQLQPGEPADAAAYLDRSRHAEPAGPGARTGQINNCEVGDGRRIPAATASTSATTNSATTSPARSITIFDQPAPSAGRSPGTATTSTGRTPRTTTR